MQRVSGPSEKGYICLGSEGHHLAERLVQGTNFARGFTKAFFLPPAEIKMQLNTPGS